MGRLPHLPVLLAVVLAFLLLLSSPALAAPAPAPASSSKADATTAVCSKRRAWPARDTASTAAAPVPTVAASSSSSSGSGSGSGQSRMDKIKDMYAFAGFVYAINVRLISYSLYSGSKHAFFRAYLLRIINIDAPIFITRAVRASRR